MFTVNILPLKAHFPHQKHDLVVNSVILAHPELLQWSKWNGKTQCSTGVWFLTKDRNFWRTLFELLLSFFSSIATEGSGNCSRESLVTSFIQAHIVPTFPHFPSPQNSCELECYRKRHAGLFQRIWESSLQKVWTGNNLSHLKNSLPNTDSAVLKGCFHKNIYISAWFQQYNFGMVKPCPRKVGTLRQDLKSGT